MNTARPISTVGYNTKDFLNFKLNSLVENGLISFYCYIFHKGEPNGLDDPQEGKDHNHIYIEPNKRLDTSKLKKMFNEVDLNNSLPLAVKPFEFSKFPHWYLYVLHDPFYLAKKGQSRFYQYSKEDMITSDSDYLKQKVIEEVKSGEYSFGEDMNNYMNKGYSFIQYAIARNIHPMQIDAYERYWHRLIKLKNRSYTYYESYEDEKKASAEEEHLLKNNNIKLLTDENKITSD